MTSKMALEDIKEFDEMREEHNFEYELIEKELKALQIIKEKLVDVNWLKGCDVLEDYNWVNNCELEQEEYDLLKEVLL